MTSITRWAALALFASLYPTAEVQAHPHVYADARMEVVGDAAGKFVSVRNIWRMDELFSSSVVVDFDKNANGILDDNELQEIGDTVRESIAEWSFYTFVAIGDKTVKMLPPESIRALNQDGQLLLFFEMKAGEPIDFKAQKVTLSNFDETFFVAFTFEDDASFQLVDMPATCRKEIVVPDEDEAAQQWMASIAGLGADETVPADGVDYAKVLATRLEITCS
ncbi:ABC transporter substrate-binding protein [Aureimonas sp. SA4125]|uniref:DUF1007 family protein n=1 Tax=Aureimonas sp. SA4125 TaxID=2826993 RepID=UPI001CC53530|nr:DUF1007 family protein [Aureimonas sp. SA4125]BDA86052.1 ABC transporter substrate-binding protein [Aureimonas sp. SA4125]